MRPTILFIDAGYLSYVARHFGAGKPLKFRLEKFAANLCRDLRLECREIYFYTAPPFQSPRPTKAENERKANYDRFVAGIAKATPRINVREGRLQRIGNAFTQKGVDALMAMDLLRVAREEDVEELVIVTADTDFVPIIDDIRKNRSPKVVLAYFTDRKRNSSFSLSNHLWKAVDGKILIRREHFSEDFQPGGESRRA